MEGYNEFWIYFVVNCVSIGCFVLWEEVYVGVRLDS